MKFGENTKRSKVEWTKPEPLSYLIRWISWFAHANHLERGMDATDWIGRCFKRERGGPLEAYQSTGWPNRIYPLNAAVFPILFGNT